MPPLVSKASAKYFRSDRLRLPTHGNTHPVRALIPPTLLLLRQTQPLQLTVPIPFQIQERQQRQLQPTFHRFKPTKPILVESQRALPLLEE
jgi:hypothetical protein